MHFVMYISQIIICTSYLYSVGCQLYFNTTERKNKLFRGTYPSLGGHMVCSSSFLSILINAKYCIMVCHVGNHKNLVV